MKIQRPRLSKSPWHKTLSHRQWATGALFFLTATFLLRQDIQQVTSDPFGLRTTSEEKPPYQPNVTLLQDIASGRYLPIVPQKSHETHVRGSSCADEDTYLVHMRQRYINWNLSRVDEHGIYLKTDYLERNNIWQLALDDKFGSYLFAKAQGVRVPHIYTCGPFTETLQHLDASPSSSNNPLPKNSGFVVKTIQGHSSVGVWVFDRGLPGWETIRGGDYTLQSLSQARGPNSDRFMFVEEIIPAEVPGEQILDYKVFAFDGEIAAISIMAHRGTERECTLQVDEFYQPINSVCVREKQPLGYSEKCQGRNICSFCTASQTPKGWPQLIQAAKKLSRRMGVAFRIDFYLDSIKGEPVLGEITPCSTAAHFHCLGKVLPHRPRFWGKSPPPSVVPEEKPANFDACWLGKMWKDHSPPSATNAVEGGPITPVPAYLEGWYDLDVAEKCRRVLNADQFLAEHPDHYTPGP